MHLRRDPLGWLAVALLQERLGEIHLVVTGDERHALVVVVVVGSAYVSLNIDTRHT
jgi:hypothetical protein